MKFHFFSLDKMCASEINFRIVVVHVSSREPQCARKFKKVQAKISWNQILIKFREIFFWPNSIFCSFRNGQKSIFELGKSWKVPKMLFHKKIYLFIYIWLFGIFLPGLKIFWPAVSTRTVRYVVQWPVRTQCDIYYLCMAMRSRQEKLKNSRQKYSWNKINHFFFVKWHFWQF